MRLLLIGPLPPPIGGARVLFSKFTQTLQSIPECEVEVIQTWSPRGSWWTKMKEAFSCFSAILKKSRDVDLISFWASYNGSLFFSPLVWLAAKKAGIPWQVRRFGSGMRKSWEEMGPFEKILTKFLFHKADQILLETKTALGELKKNFPQTKFGWHGNFRPIPSGVEHVFKKTCRRFVFLGKIIPEKGVEEIIQAAGRFPPGEIEVGLYGTLTGAYLELNFESFRNLSYCGIASPDSIPELLSGFDALLLPTRYYREGYPGVILEAYMAGIPVITSDMPSLKEIVDARSGILVKANAPNELYEAMRLLTSNPERYQALARGAYEKREHFSLQTGVQRYIELCRAAVDGYQRLDDIGA